ncbi:tetratricopeptide repeat protein [Bdellovibrio sp. HCB337]|uniref:tetratricopeptide repeat protein n=1 Tax=Bdellovibrio sp. HCB337 TaxID=3394358 RepID=UPI0039A4921A
MSKLKLRISVVSLLISLVSASAAQAEKVSGLIQDQGDTVHLELTGQQNWDYDLRRAEKGGKTYLQLTVSAMDEASLRKLASFKSDMVTNVSVDKAGPDGKYIVSFQVSGDEVESFDYLTDQPSRLIVDFYVNSQNKVKTAEVPAPKKEASAGKPAVTELPEKGAKPAETSEKEKTAVTKPGKDGKARKPATADVLVVKNDGANSHDSTPSRSGLFDGGDPNFERFSIKDYEIKEDSIIRSKDSYFIPYPMIRAENHYWEKMKTAAPIYEIAPQNTDENKQARLLWTLFENKRYATYLKTEEWFHNKYPQSEYDSLIDFMTADVYKTLWQDKEDPKYYEIAQVKYKQAIQKNPKSPLVERTSLMLGNMALDKGDSLDAIRLFNEHIEKNYAGKPDAVSNDLARMGTGVAYMKLNRHQEAAEIFSKLAKDSAHKEIKAEAAYREGDVYVQAKNYQKAVDTYKEAIKKFPDFQNQYPNAYYNQAEALFGMGAYRQALDVYLEFMKKFPSHEHAAFAMTRMGELLDILGADKARVMGAYLETYFRYGESNNAIVARLRLTSARMKGMKPKETEAATKEILSLVKKLDIPNIEQFGTIMISEGYGARKEHEKAIKLLTDYYQQNPTSVDRELFKKRIIGNITDEIHDQVASGDFIKALKTHSKYAENWLKNNDRIDTRFYLAESFEMAGANSEAEKHYRDVLNQVYAIKGSKREKELAITNQKPTEDELNLRLAVTTYQQKKLNQSYDYLKNIKTPENLSEDQQIERVRIAVDLLEKRGDLDSSVRYLTELLRTWKGQAHLVAEPYLRLAQLEVKQGKPESAIESLKKVDVLMADSKNVPENVHAKSLEMVGQLYLDKNDGENAIGAFDKLLNTYEEKRPLASIRYKMGQIYFKKGDVQKAADVWSKLKSHKSQFWYNLAQEQLKNSEWRGDYKKYIDRIPAMSKQQ